ncbi:MAG: MotA/TolQ/ExbB proton channel family protein [Myxococcales bacterium]|nr:MotA/TolQ/ExbB proton channel family protein [Myxococcales bacterium]
MRRALAMAVALWAVLGAAWAAPPDLQALFEQEQAELEATRDGLAQEIQDLTRRREADLAQARRRLAALEAELADLHAAEADARAAAQQVAQRTAGADEDAALLEGTLRGAARALAQHGDALPAGAPEARLVDALRRASGHLAAATRVRAVPGRFYGSDGAPVDGPIAHVGRVAALGGGGGALRPTGDGDLAVVEAAPQAATRVVQGQAAVAPLFLRDPDGPLPPVQRDKTFSDLLEGAGLIGWVIVGLGGLALLVALERALTLLLIGAGRTVTRDVCGALAHGDLTAARAAMAGPGAMRRVLGVLLAEPDETHAHLEEVAARAVFRELPRLERLLPLLRTVAAVAPLLGLLGTVTGMIATFDVITEYGTGDPKRLSGGISQALITTELGLAVAIPTLLLHTLLDRWASRILTRLQTDSLVVIHDLACHRPDGHPHAHHHHHGDAGHHPGAHHDGPPA